MGKTIKCYAHLTEWVDTREYSKFGLTKKIIDDLNIAIKDLINKSINDGGKVESAHIFLKDDLTNGETNLRTYVTLCGEKNDKDTGNWLRN